MSMRFELVLHPVRILAFIIIISIKKPAIAVVSNSIKALKLMLFHVNKMVISLAG